MLFGLVVGAADVVVRVLVATGSGEEVVGSGTNRVCVEVLSSEEVNMMTDFDVDVEVETKKDVEVSSSGTDSVKKMVEVTVLPGRVSTPPGPVQRRPIGQHPYAPLVPSQHVELRGHPPCWSGQHVYVRGMQPSPQAFRPDSLHGIGTVCRLLKTGKASAARAEAERAEIRSALSMMGTNRVSVLERENEGLWTSSTTGLIC